MCVEVRADLYREVEDGAEFDVEHALQSARTAVALLPPPPQGSLRNPATLWRRLPLPRPKGSKSTLQRLQKQQRF